MKAIFFVFTFAAYKRSIKASSQWLWKQPRKGFVYTYCHLLHRNVYHCVNGDGLFDEQNGFCIHSVHQMVSLIETDKKTDTVTVRVN